MGTPSGLSSGESESATETSANSDPSESQAQQVRSPNFLARSLTRIGTHYPFSVAISDVMHPGDGGTGYSVQPSSSERDGAAPIVWRGSTGGSVERPEGTAYLWLEIVGAR